MSNVDLHMASQALVSMAEAIGIAELEGSPSDILDAHRETVHDAVLRYLVQSDAGSRAFVNEIKRSIVDSFPEMFYLNYFENAEEIDPEDDKWLTAEIARHVGYVDGTFEELKAFKDKELPPRELEDEATRRAEAYAASLNGVGIEGKLRGLKNQKLWWVLGNAEKHCRTCVDLDGQAHAARWYLKRNYIPGKPGAGMDCWGRFCDCHLKDKDGNVVEIGE